MTKRTYIAWVLIRVSWTYIITTCDKTWISYYTIAIIKTDLTLLVEALYLVFIFCDIKELAADRKKGKFMQYSINNYH